MWRLILAAVEGRVEVGKVDWDMEQRQCLPARKPVELGQVCFSLSKHQTQEYHNCQFVAPHRDSLGQ